MTVWKTSYGWRYQFMLKGKEYSKSGFPTMRECKTAEEDRKAEVRKALTKTSSTEPNALDFGYLALMYLEDRERRITLDHWRYRKGYNHKAFVLNSFMAFIGQKVVSEITPFLIQSYLKTRPTNINWNRHRREIHALFEWARKKRMVVYNPCYEVDTQPEPQFERKIPTPEEMSRILLAAGSDQDFLLVLYYTLGRPDEIMRLCWPDMNFENRIVGLKTRKGKTGEWKTDNLFMHDGLYKVLKRLWDKRTSEGYVFINPRTNDRYYTRPKLMRKVCKQAGVPYYPLYAIRHYVGSLLADEERESSIRLKPVYRHTRLATTERYLHLRRVDPTVREVMAKIPDPLAGSKIYFLNVVPQKSDSQIL